MEKGSGQESNVVICDVAISEVYCNQFPAKSVASIAQGSAFSIHLKQNFLTLQLLDAVFATWRVYVLSEWVVECSVQWRSFKKKKCWLSHWLLVARDHTLAYTGSAELAIKTLWLPLLCWTVVYPCMVNCATSLPALYPKEIQLYEWGCC